MPDDTCTYLNAETSRVDRSDRRHAVHDCSRYQRNDRGARPHRVRWIEPYQHIFLRTRDFRYRQWGAAREFAPGHPWLGDPSQRGDDDHWFRL